jgi:transposase
MLQEIRVMRFEEVHCGWNESRLSQKKAACVLGVSDRTFRRYIHRYEEEGIEGLSDKRLTQASFRRAPVDEVMALSSKYEVRYRGWNVRHFYFWYKKDGGSRSYSWVEKTLQLRV